MNSDFLQALLRQHSPTQAAEVRAVRPRPLDSSTSILSSLTAGRTAQPIGLFGLEAELREAGQPWRTERLVLKAKPHARAICQMITGLAQACGGAVAEVYPAFEYLTGFGATHWRELAVYATPAAALLPRVWATHADPATDTYLVVLEDLSERELLNSVLAPAHWTDAHLRAALRQLAAWHAHHLVPNGAAAPEAAPATWPQLAPLWEALLDHAGRHFPDQYSAARRQQLSQAIRAVPSNWATLGTLPKTLIHNDLNPRNTCFRPGADGQPQLVAYDWELATYHLPQYDAVELLCFVLGPDRYHLRAEYLDYYRQQLHACTGCFADAAAFAEGTRLATLEFGLHRLGLYLLPHALSPYPFLPRVIESFFAAMAGDC
ncbi:aminoglycoside phosphotransferase family protein [Hymenobacter setariae]|uniref:Aminoglycoside phosphotransferase family protein n=1 Tax=Hymenobacter setariae TaxID=2594794 RepID=A0A558C3X7_9BACT|nr:aminoglycoside phosphotransferase family protein [Hymenobacter setariae]TVT43499.1 aminoglycoside phosphotransferase family protein [Hymenobacter setariae]